MGRQSERARPPLLRQLNPEWGAALGISNPPGRSSSHGEAHWKHVILMGLWLDKAMPGVDHDLVMLFDYAIWHDLFRQHDGDDTGHGQRAAAVFAAAHPLAAGYYDPSRGAGTRERYMTLEHAIALHEHAETANDPTTSLCWDADRLLLTRVGIPVGKHRLSTPAARTSAARAYAHALLAASTLPTWEQIYMRCLSAGADNNPHAVPPRLRDWSLPYSPSALGLGAWPAYADLEPMVNP